MRLNHFKIWPFAVVLLAFLAMLNARASATDSDVLLANVNGETTIGAANDIGTADENFNITTKVFQGVMVPHFPPFTPVDYGRDEPGFFALPSGSSSLPPGASALPASAQVAIHFPSFTVNAQNDSLFYWDGTGSVDFHPISAAQPGVAFSLIPSNPLATTHADGSVHQHSAWGLALGPNGGAVPADGVYLVSPTASVTGLSDSKPFYMLFLVDAAIDNEDDASALKDGLDEGQTVFNGKDYAYFNNARDYVTSNLVPEPSVCALASIPILALVFRRDRARTRRCGRCMS
jgi:hypothetical protein